jgi:hypothetical protein
MSSAQTYASSLYFLDKFTSSEFFFLKMDGKENAKHYSNAQYLDLCLYDLQNNPVEAMIFHLFRKVAF